MSCLINEIEDFIECGLLAILAFDDLIIGRNLGLSGIK